MATLSSTTTSSKKLSALEAHYRERFERLEKDNRTLRQKLDKLDQENAGLKKSLYELSLRYNMFSPGDTIKPFNLDTIGVGLPPDLLLSLKRTHSEQEHQQAKGRQQEDSRKFSFKYHFPRHNGAVYAVRFSHRGRLLASGSYDKTLRIWDMDKQRECFLGELHAQPVSDVQWGKGDTTVVSGSYDKHVAIWDLEAFKPLHHCEVSGMVLTVAPHPQDEHIVYAGLATKQLCVIDRRQPRPVASLMHDAMVNSTYVYRDGSHIVLADSAGYVSTWDLSTYKMLDKFANGESRMPISCIKASISATGGDEGRFFAVNSYDNVLRVYDRGSFGSRSSLSLVHSLTGHQNKNWPIQSAFFHGHLHQKGGAEDDGAAADETAGREEPKQKSVHDTLLLATGSADPQCLIWDVGGDQVELVQRLTEHPDRVYSVDFHPSEPILATGCADCSIRIFTAKTKVK